MGGRTLTRRRLLGSVVSVAAFGGCAAGDTDRETVTPAPVPTATPGTEGVDLVVRNGTAYRRTVVVVVERAGRIGFKRRLTVLAGQGRAFSEVAPRVPPVDDTTDGFVVAVRSESDEPLGEAVFQSGGLAAVVLTLLRDRVTWSTVAPR